MLPPQLLPCAGSLRPGACAAADRHHAAPARQERGGHHVAAGLCAGARPRLPGGDRFLLGVAGLEVQPPCAAHPRVARIRRHLPRHHHQARHPAAQLHPHGRRGRDHRPPGRSALGGARGLADGQPRRLLHPRRPLQGCPGGQFAAHPRQLLGVVHLGGAYAHAQHLARTDRLHALARRGPHRHHHGARAGRGVDPLVAARNVAARPVASSQLRSAQGLARHRTRCALSGRGALGGAARSGAAGGQAPARPAAVRSHVPGPSLGARGAALTCVRSPMRSTPTG